MTDLQTNLVETEKAMRPVARFLGDSLAAAIGFAGLAVVSLVPISVLHLIKRWGNADLANSLHWLEIALFAVDIMPFLPVFLAGAAVFAAEVYVETETRSIELLQRRKEMIGRLRAQFLMGFNEGWSMYWTSFAAIARHARHLWVTHGHRLNAQS